MPTIHQPNVSDPIEQRLRHLGDHLDAEREARPQQSSVLPTADPNAGTHVGDIDPGSDAQGRSPYRWWAAAAAFVAIVAASAVIVANRGSSTVQSAPATTSDATTPPATVESVASTAADTAPVPETTPTSTDPAGPASSIVGSTLPDDSAVDGLGAETAWMLWPDDASVQSGQLQPGQPGPVFMSAAGPNGVVYSAPTSDTVDLADIWVTPDGVGQNSAANDGLSGLWQPEVAATSSAYFVAAAAEQDGEKTLWRSANGIDWAELVRPFDGYLVGVLGGPGPTLFRYPAANASGEDQSQIEWSDDGLTWTPVETYGASKDEPGTYSIAGVAWVGGEHGYVAFTDNDRQLAESVDGHRWTLLPPPPAIGSPALVDGGIIMLSAESEDCVEPCPQAYRFDDQSREWSPVATPPLDEHPYLARVGDTLVATGADADGVGRVFVSPVDEIAWNQVEVEGDLADIWLGQVHGKGNRVIIPAGDASSVNGRFVVGAVADGGVADYGLVSLPMCDAATGPVAEDCVYEVVSGDNPKSIAQKFGVDIETLFAANADVPVPPLVAMLVGTRIIIPAPNG